MKKDINSMAYILFNSNIPLNESGEAAMTAAQLKQARITSMAGYGGEMISVNGNGFMVNPADHLPNGLLDKLKNAWNSSDGNVDTFFSQNIDGKSVKSILSECPSQQSYGIAKAIGLPDGTHVPCQNFTDKGYSAIKVGTSSTPPPDGGGTVPPAAPDAGSPDAGGADPGAGSGDAPVAGGDSNWWQFFGTKEFLIGTAVFAGVLAAIKALGNTIKARFRKCAKVLYNMQKDFGTKENGMDMKAVLPGVGSKITDWITRLWGIKKGPGKDKGALGLRPFVDNYRNEMAADYQEARKAFNMIAAAGKDVDDKKREEQNSGASNNLATPESAGTVYTSFTEMFNAEPLNESEELNEALGTAAIISLGSLAVRGGMYLFSKKDKNGKDIAEAKPVQVTHQSTREICYSILNMFFSKYFNLEAVSKKMGMDVSSLGDLDKSSVDKFAKIAAAMKEEQAQGKTSKMYTRAEKNYKEMVAAYGRIADNVVNNFEKFTKKRKDLKGNIQELSEKDSNLLVASTEKLRAEVNRQKDAYENNFFRVINAIVTSPEYTTYIDFIIKDVIPVFKTGLASDADYVLDIVPKEGEYYIIHQSNQQTELADGDTAKENVALARVLGFDQSGDKAKNPVIKFARVALLKNPGILSRNDKNEYDMTGYREEDLDRTAYGKGRGENADRHENGDVIELQYNKWMALDPIIAKNVPGDDRDGEDMGKTKLYHRVVKTEDGREIDEYVFGISTNVKTSESVNIENINNISEDSTNGRVTIGNEANNKESENISGETPEIPIDNTQSDIVKLACVNIAKGTNLADDVKTNQFTGAFIFLGNKCTAKEADEKFKALGFEALDGKIKEKEQIENNIAHNIGYTHVASDKADNVTSIDDVVKKIETRQTTGEKLLAKSPEFAKDLFNNIKALGLTPEQLQTPFYLDGGAKKQGVLTTAETKFKQYPTGIQNKNGEEIVLYTIPALIGQDGKPVPAPIKESVNEADSSTYTSATPAASTNNASATTNEQPSAQQPQQSTQGEVGVIISIINHVDKSGQIAANYYIGSKLDETSIKAAFDNVINKLVEYLKVEGQRGQQIGKQEESAQESAQISNEPTMQVSSIEIEYDKYFNIAESFMSSFGFTGANQLHVNRKIKAPKSKNTYYVLSENAWGDGSKQDPEKYIKDTLDFILEHNKSYDDFAKVAKNSRTTNLIKLDEECGYNTALPYNRYQMLTISNPLYEGTIIVRFDSDNNLVESIRLGVKKIYCETV